MVSRSFFQQCGELALTSPAHQDVLADDAARIAQGAERFLEALGSAPALVPDAAPLPLVEHMGDGVTELGRAFSSIAATLPWSISPRKHDLEGVNTGLVIVNDLFDLGDVSAGVLVMLPDAYYPEHSHPPQELYVMIDGTASWRYGGADAYVEVTPGGTIYNHENDWHGIHANRDVVVAMYVLWEGDTQ